MLHSWSQVWWCSADEIQAHTSGEFVFLPEVVASRVLGATAYRFVLNTGRETGSETTVWETETDTHTAQPAGFDVEERTYSWQVQAQQDGEWGELCLPPAEFTMVSGITGISPEDGATVTDITPTFDWDDVDGVAGYEVEVAETEAGVETAAVVNIAQSEYTKPTAMSDGDRVYWRVRAMNSDSAIGPWSGNFVVRARVYEVGETGPAGGVVFFDRGDYIDGWRYLEAAPSDQADDAEWGALGLYVGATEREVGTGKTNTAAIVELLGRGHYAARICHDLELGGVTDWFLPSIDELALMYALSDQIGGFAHTSYWSSTETQTTTAAYIDMYDGEIFEYGGKEQGEWHSILHVRAIRAF